MRICTCIAVLLLLMACATSPTPHAGEPVPKDPRLANLQRAATLPWRDQGRCAVHEASHPWPVLVEECFPRLDHDRLRFNDPTGRCAVASADTVVLGIGLCVLAAPEVVVGAVVIAGAVVVGFAIQEALDAYELKGSRPTGAEPSLTTKPAPPELAMSRRHKPEPAGQDWLPPVPTGPETQERSPDCAPRPVPHLGGDAMHNRCADLVPQNGFPGADVLVNGKRFDALQLRTRVLWEIKTDHFDTFTVALREIVIEKQVLEAQRERDLARACGYSFAMGVRSHAHRKALRDADPSLTIVVMDWC
ncbi:hypothetical protein JGU66_29740 [Myxococcaceae bacterium JPH2]|nr:hypothetical protein [Myxococcaceae bacterium JPH2]